MDDRATPGAWGVCGRFPHLNVCGCTVSCRRTHATIDIVLNRVCTGVFVGPIQSAFFHDVLQQRNITHVVNASGEKYREYPGIEYLAVRFVDDESVDITQYFARVLPFMHAAVAAGGGVLVHCQAGVSRSVTFVTAYLMVAKRMTRDAALERIREVRPWAQPNRGFMMQLATLEAQLADGSVAIDKLLTMPTTATPQ